MLQKNWTILRIFCYQVIYPARLLALKQHIFIKISNSFLFRSSFIEICRHYDPSFRHPQFV